MTLQTTLASSGAKLLAILLLALGVGLVIRAAYLKAYDSGVQAERATWQAAQDKAGREQAARESRAQSASEEVSDRTRSETTAAVSAASTETEKSIERIEYVYLENPAAASPCRPDGGPAPIPDLVQDELRKARGAAEAAARGL